MLLQVKIKKKCRFTRAIYTFFCIYELQFSLFMIRSVSRQLQLGRLTLTTTYKWDGRELNPILRYFERHPSNNYHNNAQARISTIWVTYCFRRLLIVKELLVLTVASHKASLFYLSHGYYPLVERLMSFQLLLFLLQKHILSSSVLLFNIKIFS